MSDDTWSRDEPLSPCVKVCVIHPAERLCVGCHRTIDEIAQWGGMDDDERRRIMAELPSRAGRLAKRRGGRRGRRATEGGSG